MKKIRCIIVATLVAIFLFSTFVGCNSTSSKTSKEDESEILYPISEEKHGKILYGYLDKEGKKVVDCKYDNAFKSVNGMSIIVLNNKFSFININGKLITPNIEFQSVYNFREGLAAVRNNNKY